MRKQLIVPAAQDHAQPEDLQWLDLESLANVEITSEDTKHSIESALLPGDGSGWRAGGPGKQVIRLLFAEPLKLCRIQLRFEESTVARTQEYVLRWSRNNGQSFEEIVRQQWNFSPEGSTTETEDIVVELAGVTTLELIIDPDTSSDTAVATLASLRLA